MKLIYALFDEKDNKDIYCPKEVIFDKRFTVKIKDKKIEITQNKFYRNDERYSITAIVGENGSGKTSLMRSLHKNYIEYQFLFIYFTSDGYYLFTNNLDYEGYTLDNFKLQIIGQPIIENQNYYYLGTKKITKLNIQRCYISNTFDNNFTYISDNNYSNENLLHEAQENINMATQSIEKEYKKNELIRNLECYFMREEDIIKPQNYEIVIDLSFNNIYVQKDKYIYLYKKWIEIIGDFNIDGIKKGEDHLRLAMLIRVIPKIYLEITNSFITWEEENYFKEIYKIISVISENQHLMFDKNKYSNEDELKEWAMNSIHLEYVQIIDKIQEYISQNLEEKYKKKKIQIDNNLKINNSNYKKVIENVKEYLEEIKILEAYTKKSCVSNISYKAFQSSYLVHQDLDKEAVRELIDVLKETNYISSFFDITINDPLSTGEYAKMTLFSKIYAALSNNNNKEPKLILIDEIDAYLHPQWQLKIIKELREFLEYYLKGKSEYIQVIISTHSPLILSDFFSDDIVCLKDKHQLDLEMKTFGANIHSLFKYEFFLSSTMGDYAKETINDRYKYLKKYDCKALQNERLKQKYVYLIDNIGEPLIKSKFQELYNEKFKQDLESLSKKIRELETQLELDKQKTDKSKLELVKKKMESLVNEIDDYMKERE